MRSKSKSVRVLFITSTFPRFEGDGYAGWLGDLARRLKKTGVEVDVFAPAFQGLSSHGYFGIPVYRFRYAPSFLEVLTHDEGAVSVIRRNPFFIIVAVFYLLLGSLATVRHLRRHEYDILHVHWPFPNGIFGVIGRHMQNVKLILSFHGAEFTLMRRVPFGKMVLSYIIKNSDGVIANSLHTREEIQGVVEVHSDIIPFASDFAFTRTAPREEIEGGDRRILFVGRLIERKGVEFLISAIQDVLREIDVKLYIVGSGPLASKLERQSSLLGLQDDVVFCGKITDRELRKMYRQCSVFVLPSIIDRWGDTEGLGMVLIEAMGFKKPVVASSVGGIVDIVRHGKTGLLVPEKDPVLLAGAIKKILKDRSLAQRLGEAGYRYAMDNFSWDAVIRKTLRVYRV